MEVGVIMVKKKIINSVDLRTPLVCNVFGEIFCDANEYGFDMDDFTKKFLTSNFCARCMDTLWSVYQIWWTSESISELQEEVSIKKISSTLKCRDTLYWIGYIYKLMYYSYGITSKELYVKLPFKKMMYYFYSLHVMSYEQACSEIFEDNFLDEYRL